VVDRPKLEHLLERLGAYQAELRRLGELSREGFLQDPDKVGSAKYHFVIAIETCIAIANHVIASEELRFPSDNADALIVLVEHGWVPEAQRDPLASMARFRNRLVHLYEQVEDERVYAYLQDSLDGLKGFREDIAQAIGS
jgi:uncharacterized protein YutE (UPF0331/DUF86 family)